MGRKLTALFLSIFLILNILPGGGVFGQADVTPPIIESISLEKQVVTLGDTVNLYIEAKDDFGIESISLHYITPVTGNIFFYVWNTILRKNI